MKQFPAGYINVKTLVVSPELKDTIDKLEDVIGQTVANLRYKPTFMIGCPYTLDPMSSFLMGSQFMVLFHCEFLPTPIDIYFTLPYVNTEWSDWTLQEYY